MDNFSDAARRNRGMRVKTAAGFYRRLLRKSNERLTCRRNEPKFVRCYFSRSRRAKTCLSVVSRDNPWKVARRVNGPGEWISCGRSPIRENRMIDRAELPPRRFVVDLKSHVTSFVAAPRKNRRETKRLGTICRVYHRVAYKLRIICLPFRKRYLCLSPILGIDGRFATAREAPKIFITSTLPSERSIRAHSIIICNNFIREFNEIL